MPDSCKQYDLKGYCLKGPWCLDKHGVDLIELDVANYDGLLDAVHKAVAISRQQQNDLKRKQTDLLRNLVSQQRTLIDKIELCSDESEKVRLKAVLNEMSQKTKDWIQAQSSQQNTPRPSVPAVIPTNSEAGPASCGPRK